MHLDRRDFLRCAGVGAAAMGVGAGRAAAAAALTLPHGLHVGHQNDATEATLKRLAAFGVVHIDGGMPSPRFDEQWSVAALRQLRRRVEGHGIHLDCLLLPLPSARIAQAPYPAILKGEEPARTRAVQDIRGMIRNAGEAGIPMLRYNLTFLGVVRTGRRTIRGGANGAAFEYAKADPDGPMTDAGPVDAEENWRRITWFLEQVIPAAEQAGVRLALHPNDPGLPPGRPFRGIVPVLASVAGLKRFVDLVSSPCHGLNFCQGTVSEMLRHPNEEIHDVIRFFGSRKKIFNVHFRNIAGGFLDFTETLPDAGSVDMPRALRTYREVGYRGMIMPDHVPAIEGDADGTRAFAYCYGYIQGLLQTLG